MPGSNPVTLFDISEKVALITGATGGLGQAAAQGFAAAGARVMLTGRHDETLAPLAASIAAAGGMVGHVAGNPDDPVDMHRIVDAAVARFGGIDILITAAGMNRVHPITEFPLEEWDAVMDANVKATWLACKEVGRVLIEQGRGGKVILVSSTRGELGQKNYSAYCPSKGAIHLMTRALACEWGPHRINVNAIAPTVFRTALTQWMFDDQAFYKTILARIPLGRLGEPEDLIGTLLYLASPASDFVTGAIMYVDGGYTAG
ncbi:MAG TPA: glucose 1-dehydrogenase [Chloroflexota bacterium]|nr:glucose 1-dehydrogenase [Chloroflexota bacterium]